MAHAGKFLEFAALHVDEPDFRRTDGAAEIGGEHHRLRFVVERHRRLGAAPELAVADLNKAADRVGGDIGGEDESRFLARVGKGEDGCGVGTLVFADA